MHISQLIFYLSLLNQVCYHDYDLHSLLPNHSPETRNCIHKRPLCSDVSSGLLKTINEACIYVLWSS